MEVARFDLAGDKSATVCGVEPLEDGVPGDSPSLALTRSRASLAAARAEVALILASLDAAIASSPAATAASDILTALSMADSREECDMVAVAEKLEV